MSTHNIGFYEDLTKIIFELSSNIIKYAPYSAVFKYKFACFSVKNYVVGSHYAWQPLARALWKNC